MNSQPMLDQSNEWMKLELNNRKEKHQYNILAHI